MRANELPQTSRPPARGDVCVILAASGAPEHLRRCIESVRAHTHSRTPVLSVAASAADVNRAVEQFAPADVVVLDEAVVLTPDWLERLREAALSDTNTATASALVDTGGDLALSREPDSGDDLARLSDRVERQSLRLRPRLARSVGPCVYVRREALELVGELDPELELRLALEVDFAQRCVLAGLAHVAADDVLVQRLAPAAQLGPASASLLERSTGKGGGGGPHLTLDAAPTLAESSVLAHALRAVRDPHERLSVTLDARALDGAVMGTQVHVLQLILALARADALRLRLLVRTELIDGETLELLRSLPETEILAAEELDPDTPRSAIFHRPQQTFSPGDVALAVALGERIVISQLDLIAYRNPGYFADDESWEDYRRASRHGLSAAERVVVFSEHTRRELLSDRLVEDARVRVVPPGLDHRSASEQRRPQGLPPALDPGFLLCLGTDFRHKNRLFALRLLGALRDRHDWQGVLVLAGTHMPRGSSLELERELLRERADLREAVIHLDAVGEEEKAWLIARAGALVYPSVYEGFGLVPFESALGGVPCVFAEQSSLAEAAPEGTATIVPWDAAASADAVHALLTDADVRARHVTALATAARELTWERAAGSMVEIYREAAVAPVRDSATLSRDAVQRERRLSVEHRLEAAQLVREREHAQRMYDELNLEVGDGLSLIGPHGALPESVQRALLALSARPALSRPLFGALARAFLASRATARLLRRGSARRPPP
jgi:glycosyltransferase involved in cell wall biosynthesis